MVPARSVSCYVACGVSGLLFSVVTLACSPLLAHNRVLAPNGGEVFSGGAPHEIVWGIDIPHALLDWDVWYSTTSADGPWTEIAMDLPAGDPSQGSVHRYDWLVPNIAASQAWVRVRMDNDNNLDIDYEDVSDAPFSILPDTVACDFNGSGDCGLEDLNLLLAEGPVAAGVTVTSANGQFDLNGDGRIDNADVDDWARDRRGRGRPCGPLPSWGCRSERVRGRPGLPCLERLEVPSHLALGPRRLQR